MPINFLAGQVLVFDKPLGMTSFGLVAKVRWLLTRAMGGRKIKVGHAGTLDPLASGVMLLCTGRATKQIETLQAGTKTYEATIQLGATTPSFDLEHAIDAIATVTGRLFTGFVLPGGHAAAAQCHVCRAVCRRMERDMLRCGMQEWDGGEGMLAYVNRLSDFLYALVKKINFLTDNEEIRA